MHTRLELAAPAVVLLTVALAGGAAAQRSSGPQLEVTVMASNSPPAGANVRAQRLFYPELRELLLHGFPAALHFRLELWRVGGMFDDIESATQWDVLVRYEP